MKHGYTWFGTNGKFRVLQRPSETRETKYQKTKMQTVIIFIILLGVLRWNKRGALIGLNTSLTGDRFMVISNASMDFIYISKDGFFQQNSVKCIHIQVSQFLVWGEFWRFPMICVAILHARRERNQA